MPRDRRQRVAATGGVAVITDSGCCLPAGLVRQLALRVVPLRLLAGDVAADDDAAGLPDVIGQQVAAGHRLLTSRPTPEAFAAAYQQAADDGAAAIVSVHLCAGLSGTIESAELAACAAAVPVLVVDSQSIGAGQGLTVLAAAAAARAGHPAADVAAAAAARAAEVGSFFAADSPAALLAGGRLTTVQRLGPAAFPPLVSRPLLALQAGRPQLVDRVRTRAAALARLAELAAGFAAGRPADIAVQHCGCPDRAAALMDLLLAQIPAARPLGIIGAGAVIWSHAGPGMVGVALAPASPEKTWRARTAGAAWLAA